MESKDSLMIDTLGFVMKTDYVDIPPAPSRSGCETDRKVGLSVLGLPRCTLNFATASTHPSRVSDRPAEDHCSIARNMARERLSMCRQQPLLDRDMHTVARPLQRQQRGWPIASRSASSRCTD